MSLKLFNQNGYLLDLQMWNEALAEEIAEQECLTLSPAHWEILRALRQFYQQYATLPTMRAFLNYLQRECDLKDIDSPQLYALFPKGPIAQGAKIAGLPKPKHCI